MSDSTCNYKPFEEFFANMDLDLWCDILKELPRKGTSGFKRNEGYFGNKCFKIAELIQTVKKYYDHTLANASSSHDSWYD